MYARRNKYDGETMLVKIYIDKTLKTFQNYQQNAALWKTESSTIPILLTPVDAILLNRSDGNYCIKLN